MTHSPVELPSHLSDLLPQSGFADLKILVVGDVMLDRYISGEVTRISPEAPVPVLSVRQEKLTAGGAANVALNLAGLNVSTQIAGVIGADESGRELTSILVSKNVDVSTILRESGRPTTSKTRVMCGSHQLVRLDEETTSSPSESTLHTLRQAILKALDSTIDAVILSDYAKGLLGMPLTRFVIDECSAKNIPVFVDPKRKDFAPYHGATCLTPNLKEFQTAAFALSDDDMVTAGQALRRQTGSFMLLITEGANGMTLLSAEEQHHFHSLSEEVFDVSGAGDTVIAVFAAAFASGLSPLLAAEFSNIAASVVVKKIGTVPISWNDFRIPSMSAADPTMTTSAAKSE